MSEDAVTVKRVRVRVLEYNQARCNICQLVVKGLSSGAVFKYDCRCGNKWSGRPAQLVPLVAVNGHGHNGNGNGNGTKTATCPECGHHFPLTTNGANGNGKSNGKHH